MQTLVSIRENPLSSDEVITEETIHFPIDHLANQSRFVDRIRMHPSQSGMLFLNESSRQAGIMRMNHIRADLGGKKDFQFSNDAGQGQ